MRVVGLDLSLTGTGIAVHDTTWGQPIPATSTHGSSTAGDAVDRRSLRLRSLAGRIYEATAGADLAVIEGPAYGKSDAHTWDRAGLWWLVAARITAQHIPLAVAPPQQVKMYATGKGNASKDQVLAAVIRRYRDVAVEDNNQADALMLCLMGARFLRHPYEAGELPLTHARALTGVVWPNITAL